MPENGHQLWCLRSIHRQQRRQRMTQAMKAEVGWQLRFLADGTPWLFRNDVAFAFRRHEHEVIKLTLGLSREDGLRHRGQGDDARLCCCGAGLVTGRGNNDPPVLQIDMSQTSRRSQSASRPSRR